MTTIYYRQQQYQPQPGETLLKMFLRRGVSVPYSCGGGSCHFCLHRCREGQIPTQAQRGLRKAQRDQQFFLLCQCIPETDMVIELPTRQERLHRMEIVSLKHQQDGCTLELAPFAQFRATAGQFITLLTEDNQQFQARITEPEPCEELLTVTLLEATLPTSLREGDALEAQGPFQQLPGQADMPSGIRRPFPAPNPSLWRALNNGSRLTALLKVFYHRVFRDPLLQPYFEHVTENRLVEKQYNFLRQAITGEKIYFGERPRNGHHWMVITDALFDHRSAILRQVLEEFELPAAQIQALLDIEEHYREDIVKPQPWPKVLFGQSLPVEGYEPLVLDAATLCDSCCGPIDRGEKVLYHVRTGKLYCSHCRGN